ncbi:MAG: ribonuclease P protein component [Nocardioidaceae bacterium]
MLPSRHRLRRSADFARAVRRGRRAGSPTLVVHALGAGGPQPTEVGFVVGKAVGGAVVRNRVKRRLRHAMSQRLNRPAASLLVVRALPAAADVDFCTLCADLDRCLDTAEERRVRR